MKQLSHLGTTEFVSLPDDGIQNVPAKIDTGAENSAIWASSIHIEDGKLIFYFFAPGSMYYRNERVVTTAFRSITVKNSFGDKEFRYKIKLKVTIGDRTLTRWFTLADRSRNKFPILIGKTFLKNKFIVDVSQKNLVGNYSGKQKVLILTGNTAENKKFFEQVAVANTQPVSYDCTNYSDLMYSINGSATTIINLKTKEDLANYGFTYFKDHHNHEFAFSAAEYLNFKGRPFADKEFINSMSASKLSEYVKLSCHGITVPKTICVNTAYLKVNYSNISKKLGVPFVLKEMRSDKGKFNYLISNKKDYLEILKNAPSDHVYLAQRYIDNDGFYRLYVLDQEVTLAVWRASVPHEDRLKTHLNKPRGSANASNVPIEDVPSAAQNLALKAADCLDRQIAGVDLVQDKTSHKWYVLEANNDPQIRSGSFIPEKAKMVAKFFDKELNQ